MRRKRSRKEMRTTVEMKSKIVAKRRRKRVKESKSSLIKMRSTKRMKRKRKTVMDSQVKKIKKRIKYRSMKTVKSDSHRHTPREKRSKDTFLKKRTKIKPTKLWKKRLHLTRNLKR